MPRTLIIAKFDPDDCAAIADIFAESDATELPHILGASSRTLFKFHDLYIHLVETGSAVDSGLDTVRTNPLFTDVNEKLSKYVKAYDPDWAGPRDAMAEPFYFWESGRKS